MWILQAPTTCVLLSGSGRQLRPAEPSGDADADADAEDEDSVSFLELNFSVMTVWQNGILNILLVIFLPIKNVVFQLGIVLPAQKDVSV